MKTVRKMISTALVTILLFALTAPALSVGFECSAMGAIDSPYRTDCVILARFVSGWPNIQIFRPVTDMNPDDDFSPRDSLILRKQLIEWISLGKPAIQL